MKDGEGILCVHVCIHASDYEYTVYCMRLGAKWSQIVPVRLRGKGVEYRGVCDLGVDWRVGGESSFWLSGEPIYGSSSRAPCVAHCHLCSHSGE